MNPHLFRFRDWSFLKCQLVWAYRGRPEMRVMSREPTCFRDTTQAYLLYRGSVQIFMRRGSVKVTSGQWVFVSADRAGHEFSHDAEIISISMYCHWLSDLSLFPNNPPVVLQANEFPALESTALELVKLSASQPADTSGALDLTNREMDLCTYLQFVRSTDLFVQQYAQAMLALGQSWTDPVNRDSRVTQAKEIIHHQPLSWQMNESWIAEQVHLSTRQLNRLFLATERMTLRDYSQKRRMNYAVQSLAASSQLIKQIASQLGFRHTSHFSKWFHSTMGTSPRAYRDRYRKRYTEPKK